jgi:uncharacterized protein YjcR
MKGNKMAYGVIIHEEDHEEFLDMSDSEVGEIVKNMIRTFMGVPTVDTTSNKRYARALCLKVAKDNEKGRAGAPKGNQNAKKRNTFTDGCIQRDINFELLEKNIIKNGSA